MKVEENKLIKIDDDSDAAIRFASELFRSGKIFIYPTDTIYGIGGNPFDEKVISRIVELKSRDESKKFIWLLSDFERVLSYAEIANNDHLEFLNNIWPGPITVIVPLNKRTSEIIHQNTIAIRVPQNDFCLKLLNEDSRPLISTSVNKSGTEPLTMIDDIVKNFSNEVDAIFFSAKSAEKTSSTIIDLTSEKPKLIREGSIKFVELLQYFS